MPWWLFHVPCPTPDGETARDLYAKRERFFDAEVRATARELGCRDFYERFGIESERGEEFARLNGGIGLVALPDGIPETWHDAG